MQSEREKKNMELLKRFQSTIVSTVPVDDIRRIIQKLLVDTEEASLNPAVLSSVDYKTQLPSTLPVGQCWGIYTKYVKEQAKKTHPCNRIDLMLETSEVTIESNVVVEHLEEKDVTHVSTFGYVDAPLKNIDQAVFSDILAYSTQYEGEGKKRSITNLFSDKRLSTIVKYDCDLSSFRDMVDDKDRNPGLARESIYKWASTNRQMSLIVQDALIDKLPFKGKPDPRLKSMLDKVQDKINETAKNHGVAPLTFTLQGNIFQTVEYEVQMDKKKSRFKFSSYDKMCCRR